MITITDILKKINEKIYYFLESSDGFTNPPSNFS